MLSSKELKSETKVNEKPKLLIKVLINKLM